MINNSFDKFRMTASAMALIAAPLALLGADLLRHNGDYTGSEIASKVAVALFIPAIFRLRGMGRTKAEWMSFVGLALCVIGLLTVPAVVTTETLRLAVQQTGSVTPQIEQAFAGSFWRTLFFPLPVTGFEIGLVLLGISVMRSRAVHAMLSLTLIAGAVVCLVGHVNQAYVLSVVADVTFIVVFGTIGLQTWRGAPGVESDSRIDWSVVRTGA